MKRKLTQSMLMACSTAAAVSITGAAQATLILDLKASSGTSTAVNGAVVDTWSDGTTTFTRSGENATYVADSGDGIAAIDFNRSAPFLGDLTAANGNVATITDATILVWANFDGYSDHTVEFSSYYYSIEGSGNEHTLGRDGTIADGDYLYHYDGSAQTTGPNQDQPAGWNLYIAKFYSATTIANNGDDISAVAWIDSVGDGAVVSGTADLTNADGVGYSGDADKVRIGSWTTGGSGLDGQIRAIQIYNEILDAEQIQAAASAMTVPEPGSMALLAISGLLIARRRNRN